MKVGYWMIGLILLNFAITLVSLLVTSVVSLIAFCRKKQKSKAIAIVTET